MSSDALSFQTGCGDKKVLASPVSSFSSRDTNSAFAESEDKAVFGELVPHFLMLVHACLSESLIYTYHWKNTGRLSVILG